MAEAKACCFQSYRMARTFWLDVPDSVVQAAQVVGSSGSNKVAMQNRRA